MEHLQHFGLSQDPFRNEPQLRDFIETGSNDLVSLVWATMEYAPSN